MENNIDRLFQEGLSADKIEGLSMYSTEKSQWKVVQSKLHAGKKRWFLTKFLPLFLLVGTAGAVFYVSYPAEGALPLASEEKMTTSSVEEEVSVLTELDESIDFESEVKTEPENVIAQVSEEKEVLASQLVQNGANALAEKNVKSTKRNNSNESYRPINKVRESLSTANPDINAKEDVVMTNISSEEAYSYSSNETEMASSVSPYSYGSPTKPYGKKAEGTMLKHDYDAAAKSIGITSDEKGGRLNYSGDEIDALEIPSLKIVRSEDTPIMMWSNTPEEFYQPKLSWWKSLRRGIGFRFGIDGPIHFNHAQVTRSGFGYDLGTDIDLSDRWGISADYIYQELDRDITNELFDYNLPYKTELYQSFELTGSTYRYTRHTLLIGFRYSIYQQGQRLRIGLLPSFEVSGRGTALGEFVYEGPYQQEKENFEFESKLISANNLSLGIIAEYRLFAKVHLVGRFRRQVPIGSGEDWKLYNRAFVGLSYKI